VLLAIFWTRFPHSNQKVAAEVLLITGLFWCRPNLYGFLNQGFCWVGVSTRLNRRLCCSFALVNAPLSLQSNESSPRQGSFWVSILFILSIHVYRSFQIFSFCSTPFFFLPILANCFGFCLAAHLDGLASAAVKFNSLLQSYGQKALLFLSRLAGGHTNLFWGTRLGGRALIIIMAGNCVS
jgi:hypothetical protein